MRWICLQTAKYQLFLVGLCFFAFSFFLSSAHAGVALGESMSGESCEMVLRDDIEQTRQQQELRLLCAGKPAGNVYVQNQVQVSAAASDAERIKAVLQQFSRSRAATLVAQRMGCAEARLLPAGKIVALPCTLKNGGWPNLVLLRSENQKISVAEGAPSLLPVLVRALEDAASADASAPVAPAVVLNNAALASQLQTLWGFPVRLFTSADYDRYKQLMRDARVANSARKFEQSEALFRQALQLQTQLLGEDADALADTLMDLALDLSNNSRFDEANALLRRAESLVQKSSNDADRARYLTYLGYDAANRKEVDKALQYARNATQQWRKMIKGGGNPRAVLSPGAAEEAARADRGELAMALNLEANMALRNADLVGAQVAAAEAMQIINTTEGLPIWWKPDVLITLGEISLAQGRISAAETYLNTALAYRKQQMGNSVASLSVLTTLAAGYQAEGLHTSAIITYRDALKLAQAIPGGATGAFTAEQLVAFAGAVVDLAPTIKDLPSRQALYAEAFDAFQLLRGKLVEKTMAAASARMVSDDPAVQQLVGDLQTQERTRDAAKAELAYESTLPDNQRSGNVEADLALRIKTAEDKIQLQYAQIKQRFPNYSELTAPQAVPLTTLQQRLSPNEGVLSFLIGRKESYAQLVTRSDLVIARIPETSDSLAEAVKSLRRAVEVESGVVGEFDMYRAHALYKSLFSGIAGPMRGVTHLVVVPAGPLASLPFGLLLASPPVSKDYAKADWLARTVAITHSPSLKSFFAARSAAPVPKAPKPLLAFGDPAIGVQTSSADAPMHAGSVTCRAAGPAPASLLLGMSALPETAQEIKRISTLFGPESATYLRTQATETMLNSLQPQDYRVLYFATHGLLPGELKCQSEPALVLTPPTVAAKTRNEDGLLEASEISALRLNADLVVLSACNTAGGGGKFGGEALSGLAEAFFYAGARNLVVSHWQVPSAATAQLMSRMFENLGPALANGAAKSLQLAQVKMWDKAETAHPFYWAAFVLAGDGGQAADAARGATKGDKP